MKRTIPIFMIFLFLLPFISMNATAEVLIQIEKNDTWVYSITDSSTNTISFEAVNFDYFGDEDTLIRVNEIVANDTIAIPKISRIASIPMYVNCSYEGVEVFGSAIMNMSIDNIVSDEVWKTARGNILYQRETIVDTTFYFTEIHFNGSYRSDWQTNGVLTVLETMSNPTIIEPISTGTVKLNSKTIVVNGIIENVDFLNLGIETADMKPYFVFIETERYETSNLFTYMNSSCRNLTIRPLDTCMTKSFFKSNSYTFATANVDLTTTLGATEDWIYSFDAGLPLLITETSEIAVVPQGGTVNSVETVKTMELVDMSLVNSDFTFPVEPQETEPEDTSWLFLPILSGFLFTLVISRNLKKKEQ